jgi:Flp pilus assembly pilin Flp
MKMLRTVAVFLGQKDRGQDVAEYCLLTALVALLCLAIFLHVSGGLQGTWTSINAGLAAGNTTSTGGTPAGGTTGK